MNLRVFAIIMAGLIFIGGNQLMAQQGNNNPKGPKGSGVNYKMADLTEAQQKKIEELMLAHQKNMLQLKNQLSEKDARLQTLRTVDKADMAAINKNIDEIGAIRIQMMKEKENNHQQIRMQLTDEQRVKFDLRQGKGGKHPCGNCGKCMGIPGVKVPGNGQGNGPGPR